MATVTFVAPSGDVNLSTGANYSTGSLPSADDVLVFPGANDGGVNRWTVTAGHTALAAIDLQRVQFFPGTSFSTGATAVSLLVSNVTTIAAPAVEFMGVTHGQCNFTSGVAIDNLIVDSAGATLNLVGGSIPFIQNAKANVTIASGVTATTAYNFGGYVYSVPNITTMLCDNGEWVQQGGTITTAIVDSIGRYTLLNTAAATTVNGHGTGKTLHRSSGTIATYNARGASMYDPSGAPVNPTVTNLNIFGPQPTVFTKAGQITVGVTTTTLYGGGTTKTKG